MPASTVVAAASFWDISAANLVTWLIVGLGGTFAAGKSVQVLNSLVDTVTRLEKLFTDHVKDDSTHFEKLHDQLNEVQLEQARVSGRFNLNAEHL